MSETSKIDWIVFDIETARDIEASCATKGEMWQRLRAGEGGLSVAVTWDSRTQDYELYDGWTVDELAERLESFPVSCVFNHHFDVDVIESLIGRRLVLPQVVDPLEWFRQANGEKPVKGSRLSLLAEWNLGLPKEGNGADAPHLFTDGKIAHLVRYCRGDVQRLRDLVRLARDNGTLLGPNGLVELPLPSWLKDLA